MLSARKVQTIKKPGLFGDGGNLYLSVDDGGSKSWVFRHQIAGKWRKYGLGPLHTVKLAVARERAEAIRRQLLDGIDPHEARRAQEEAAALAAANTITFDDAAKQYIASHKAGWKNPKHRQQWENTLKTYASPVIGRLPVRDITTEHVLKILSPIWESKTETASRVRGRIEEVLAYAKARKWRSGENPALWRGNLKHLLPRKSEVSKVEHHPALPFAELPAFMALLGKRYGVAALALEFCILTTTRTSETLNATWDEFDLDQRVWTVSGPRMKGGREHRVPLCDRAVAIVKEMRILKGSSGFVFPGAKPRKPLSNMAMTTTLRRMKHGHITVHGFRSTFRTWVSERTEYPREIAEAALAHVIGDKTEAAYQRGDLLEKRRELMTVWAAYCNSSKKQRRSPPTKQRADKVAA